jgi:hypothetical protein
VILLALFLAAFEAGAAGTSGQVSSRSVLTQDRLRVLTERSSQDAATQRRMLSRAAADAGLAAQVLRGSTMPAARLDGVLRAASFSADLLRRIDGRSDYSERELGRVRTESGKDLQAVVDRRSGPEPGRIRTASEPSGAVSERLRASGDDGRVGRRVREAAVPSGSDQAALRRRAILDAQRLRAILGRSVD